jgi:hypothetical protein
VAAVVVVVGAAALVSLLRMPSSRRGPEIPPAVRGLKGQVVAEAPAGGLFISRPDGSHSSQLRPRALSPGTASPIVVVGDRTFATTPYAVNGNVLAGDPLADGGKAVVVTIPAADPELPSSVSVVAVTGTQVATLGRADSAAGDPAAFGAFVTVAVVLESERGRSGSNARPSDSRVELRDVGRPAAVLATAAELNGAVGADPRRAVSLAVFPDQDGGKVAVVVNSLAGNESNSAVVILDRHGRRLGSVGSGAGPIQYTSLYWSPDDRSFAFSSFDSLGVTLTVVDSTYRLASQEFDSPTSVAGCTWSPDSSWLLCQATSAFVDNWVIARNTVTLLPIYSIPGRGIPIGWLP